MGTKNPKFDAYIARSAPFARPILSHLRKAVHKACPDADETMKWGMPFFVYRGRILCFMAAFKQHAGFGFWKASALPDPNRILTKGGQAMGSFGRITAVGDLPAQRILIAYIRTAAELNERGVNVKRPAQAAKRASAAVPPSLAAALRRNGRAKAVFEAFPPSHKRDYVEWITEAKTDATRSKRVATAVEWMSKGKPRNWKYERK